MLVTVALLSGALLPTGDEGWGLTDTLGVPAICFFQSLKPKIIKSQFTSSAQMPSMVISILILFFGYLTRMVKLSKHATDLTKDWLRTKPASIIKKMIDGSDR